MVPLAVKFQSNVILSQSTSQNTDISSSTVNFVIDSLEFHYLSVVCGGETFFPWRNCAVAPPLIKLAQPPAMYSKEPTYLQTFLKVRIENYIEIQIIKL